MIKTFVYFDILLNNAWDIICMQSFTLLSLVYLIWHNRVFVFLCIEHN